MPQIEEIVSEVSKWANLDGVELVGQSEDNGKDCILVLVSRSAAEFTGVIPPTYKGFPVVIKESDIISIQEEEPGSP